MHAHLQPLSTPGKGQDLVLVLLLTGHACSHAGIPFSDVNLKTHAVAQPLWTQASSTSEATSVDLEFTFLAHASGALSYPRFASEVPNAWLDLDGS